jgi:hypothetical protein
MKPAAQQTPLSVEKATGDFYFVKALTDVPMETLLVAVLDRSGSMGGSASKPGGATPAEGNLFSRNDLVKHTMLTVAHMLVGAPAPAHLGIVSFSDNAEVELPIQRMDKPGLTTAEAAIQGIRPGGCTNIWAGLSKAIDMVVTFSKSRPNLNCHILLLTDGEPTADYIPLRGLVPAVANKLSNAKAQSGTTLTLSCFGFGYQLDTDLLDNLCKMGGGVYGYLPDCSMVGTVGIHYSASILSTAARDVELEFSDSVVKLGNIHVGQTCHFRFPGGASGAGAAAPKFPYTEAPTKDVRFEEALALVYTALSDGLNTAHHLGPMNKVAENIRELRLALSNTVSGSASSQILDILQDLDSHKDSAGQLTKAVSRIDWYNSWGKNHLISYMRQLMNQTCMNFKDLVPQHFLAPLTKKLCDAGSDIFDSLPPPTPSIVPVNYNQAGYQPRSLTTMAMFNDAGGGCWAGYCKVEMADGTSKYTSQIIPGDHVKGGYRVMAVVTTRVGRKFRMIQPVEGLVITPWHPVRVPTNNGTWTFPEEIPEKRVKNEMIHYVYNLVLEAGHVVRIGGYDVCTLGHGFEDNDVIRHPFFGTARVIQDLRRDVQGWNLGRIELRMEDVRKDAETGLVSSIMSPGLYNNAVVPNQ